MQNKIRMNNVQDLDDTNFNIDDSQFIPKNSPA